MQVHLLKDCEMAYKLHNFYYIMKIGRMIHSLFQSMFSYHPPEILSWHPLFIMHNLWLMEIVMDLNKFLLIYASEINMIHV